MAKSQIHPVTFDAEHLLRQCDVTRGRASGPGGQHRNKVETAVTIRHRETGVTGYASERRSQVENHRVALKRLRMNLALNVRAPTEKLHEPSELWQSRLQKGKIVISVRHADFPIALAEALDVLAAHLWDPKPAAIVLGCSMSQLIKFIKSERRAMGMVNDRRREMNRHPLK
jgi:hypothetical protein